MVRSVLSARVAAPATFLASLALRVGAIRAGMSEKTLDARFLENGLYQAKYDSHTKMCYWGPRADLFNDASDVLYECVGRLVSDTGLNAATHDQLLKSRPGWDLSEASRLIQVGQFVSNDAFPADRLQTRIKRESDRPVYGFHYSTHASSTLNRHYTLHLMHGEQPRSWYKVLCGNKNNKNWTYSEGEATCTARGVSLCGSVDGGENACMPESVQKCLDVFERTFDADLETLADTCKLPL